MPARRGSSTQTQIRRTYSTRKIAVETIPKRLAELVQCLWIDGTVSRIERTTVRMIRPMMPKWNTRPMTSR